MDKIRLVSRKVLGLLFLVGLLGASFLGTTYIFSQGFELASGKDLPYSNSLAPLRFSSLLTLTKDQDLNQLLSAERKGTYGEPFELRFSSQLVRLPVVAAQINGSHGETYFVGRQNTGHFAFSTVSKLGIMGDPVIYVRQSWRTFNNPEAIEPGSNIFVDTTTGWRLMYRVAEVAQVSDESKFVVPDRPSSTLTIIFHEDNATFGTVLTANYVILQNINR
ncbi:MAG: hypothetical protein WEC81_00995 [Patescibacteria group bacterium]